MRALRHLVSQNKTRTKADGFDLDLTYITDQIIAMGLPAQGSVALYRNPIGEVVAFLEKYHTSKYKVFNLCNESFAKYDISKFGAMVASFPFDDHGAPPLELVSAFCASAKSWMLLGLDHVVAIHCKAGKGRTGVMVSCLLLHLGEQRTPRAAIAYYNKQRTRDGKGLTVPSQRRCVYYYDKVLAGALREARAERDRRLVAVRLSGGILHDVTVLHVVFEEHGRADARPRRGLQLDVEARVDSSKPFMCDIPLRGDFRLVIADSSDAPLCRLWLHAALEPDEATFIVSADKMKSDVDMLPAGKGVFPEFFEIALLFEPEPAPEAAPGASEEASSAPQTSEASASGVAMVSEAE